MPRRPPARPSTASPGDARHRFTARVLASLEELASRLDGRRLAAVAAERSSGYGVLLSALEQPEAQEVLRRDDPLAPARLRGIRAREELLRAEGGAIGAPEMAALIRVTRQAVDKRRKAGKLLAVGAGARRWLYPAWQVRDGEVLPGLAEALGALAPRSPWARLGWFLSGDARLGGSRPLDALRAGRLEEVRSAARAYGEHGAA
jgi:hypothetical protein